MNKFPIQTLQSFFLYLSILLLLQTVFAKDSVAPLRPGKSPSALHGDNEHDVMIIKECDLAVKFNNHDSITTVGPFVNENVPGLKPRKPLFADHPLRSIVLLPDFSAIDFAGPPPDYHIGIECVPTNRWNSKSPFKKYFLEDLLNPRTVSKIEMPKEEFCKSAGLRPESCQKATYYQAYTVSRKKDKGASTVYIWSTPSLTYFFGMKDTDNAKGPIKIEAQIDSIAPSAPTIDITQGNYKIHFW